VDVVLFNGSQHPFEEMKSGDSKGLDGIQSDRGTLTVKLFEMDSKR
jgi:hypothetical protein